MARVSILIAGHAAPKGSRTQFANGGSRESSQRSKPWVETVAYAAMANRPRGKTLEPPYDVELTFSMPKGQRPKYDWPTKDGDLDKLVRGVLDGLVQGRLLVDDRHVTRIVTSKKFGGTPCVEVTIASFRTYGTHLPGWPLWADSSTSRRSNQSGEQYP